MEILGTLPARRFWEKHVSADDLPPRIASAAAATERTVSTFDRFSATTGPHAGRGPANRGYRATRFSSNRSSPGNATLSTRATFAMRGPVVINSSQIRQPILKNRHAGYPRQSIPHRRGDDREGRVDRCICVDRRIDAVRGAEGLRGIKANSIADRRRRVRKCKPVV